MSPAENVPFLVLYNRQMISRVTRCSREVFLEGVIFALARDGVVWFGGTEARSFGVRAVVPHPPWESRLARLGKTPSFESRTGIN